MISGFDMEKNLVLIVVLFSGGLCLAACPPADITGDCLVNFLDFQVMVLEGSFLDLQTMALQWLEPGEDDIDAEPLSLLGKVESRADEVDSFAVEFVVVDKQRIGRSVFEYECEVILKNISATTFENVELVIAAWPDNMTIINPHVTFGDAEIGPGESAISIDTCTFKVDRSVPVDPVEIIWHRITSIGDMVLIPGGTFQMGDHFNEGQVIELPVHTVTVDSFYMGRCEITSQQYCDFLNWAHDACDIKIHSGIVYGFNDTDNLYPYCDTRDAPWLTYSQIDYSGGVFSVMTKSGRDMSNGPIIEVSWYGAAAYCNWRSREDGYEHCYNLLTWNCEFGRHGYRLATEAEWEYAARGGLSGKRYAWGDSFVWSQANYYVSGDPYEDGFTPWTTPVGFYNGQLHQKADFNWPGRQSSYQTTSGINGYGLYDMVGNVCEWCNDRYGWDYYDSSPGANPQGPVVGAYRVLRSSHWNMLPTSSRVSWRDKDNPETSNRYIGFRIVLPN